MPSVSPAPPWTADCFAWFPGRPRHGERGAARTGTAELCAVSAGALQDPAAPRPVVTPAAAAAGR
ncbi:MAG TPA: hypothetical protein VK028_01715 [Micromonosporaceae bacterium]|nr:hypothetical protein [Micromonosporaceae bacterium]